MKIDKSKFVAFVITAAIFGGAFGYIFGMPKNLPTFQEIKAWFPKSEEKGDRTLIVNSQEIGTGPIKIKIKEHAINNTPSIKLL